MRVVAWSDDAVDEVGALMAREHRSARRLGLPLPSSFLDAAVCTSALVGLMSDGYAGFVARDAGRAVGVMCGTTSDDVGFVPAHGIAVATGGPDTTRIVGALLTELAPVLVADGAVRITVDHVAHDGVAEGLRDLGFGRGGVFASRTTEPIDGPNDVLDRVPNDLPNGVDVRIGSAADLDSIAALAHVEYLHRATPPMYALQPDRTLAQTRDVHQDLLDHGAIHLLAQRAGVDVGLLTIELTSPAPRLCAAEAPYIGPTATHPDARRSGVGTALVQAAIDWARTAGSETISVDFDSANPNSRSFWLGTGFCVTGHRLRRILARSS